MYIIGLCISLSSCILSAALYILFYKYNKYACQRIICKHPNIVKFNSARFHFSVFVTFVSLYPTSFRGSLFFCVKHYSRDPRQIRLNHQAWMHFFPFLSPRSTMAAPPTRKLVSRKNDIPRPRIHQPTSCRLLASHEAPGCLR